jgi:lipoic acid synthetase
MVAESVKTLGLKYVVVTSVTRDDLPDGGASVFQETIREIRRVNPECNIEVLIPDFKGDETALQKVIDATPDVINHNIEVVEELFSLIRPEGDYQRSLAVLKTIKTKNKRIHIKSGFMVGLGETTQQIHTTMLDLRAADVDFLTIGQYLQPTKHHVAISKYYTPDEFAALKTHALQLGFQHVESGPLVRSSYHAEKAVS